MEEPVEKIYNVDGISFQRDKDVLIMSFVLEGSKHSFKIQQKNAYKMAGVLQKLYLENN